MARWSTALFLISLAFCPAVASDFYVEVHGGVSLYDGTADTDGLGTGTIEELPIDGLPFDTSESTWSVVGGWQFRSWLAFEAGYTDLGKTRREPIFALVPGSPGAFTANTATLDIDQWFVGTRFSAALSDAFVADWSLGIARSEFDVDGSLPVFIGLPGFDSELRRIPFASPGAETGAVWGFGFRWRMNPRFDLGLNYRQHNTGVLDVQTVTAGLRLKL